MTLELNTKIDFGAPVTVVPHRLWRYNEHEVEGWWVWPPDALLRLKGQTTFVDCRCGHLLPFEAILHIHHYVVCEPMYVELGIRGPERTARQWRQIIIGERHQLGL